MFWIKLRSIISNRLQLLWIVPAGTVLICVAWKYHTRPRFVYVPNDVAVTIPEGTNLADIDRIIAGAGVIAPGVLLTPDHLKLEGELFPDTYRFDRGSTAEDIITRMRKEYPRRDVLIIASLLEKEVRTQNDMRLVAGIIQKRLAAGMPLQIDATVAYGVCHPEFIEGRYCDVSEVNIVDNIHRDSAYNTYTRTGLPAGPISNPGLKAIDAAQHPVASSYWYYLSTKDGMTIFSKTLEEHHRARAKYL